MKKFLVTALSLVVLSVFPASAQTDQTGFLHEAMRGDMAQMLYGRMAVQRAEGDEVVSFAQRMLREQAAANRHLIELAEIAGLPPSPVSIEDAEQHLQALRRTPPHSFDISWLALVIDAHRRLLAVYDGYAVQGEGQALRAHALEELPAIRTRLRAAEELAERTEAVAAAR